MSELEEGESVQLASGEPGEVLEVKDNSVKVLYQPHHTLAGIEDWFKKDAVVAQ